MHAPQVTWIHETESLHISFLFVILLKSKITSQLLSSMCTILYRFEEQLKTLQSNWDSQVAQLLRQTVSKDLQIQVLQEEEIKQRAQVTSLLQDIER